MAETAPETRPHRGFQFGIRLLLLLGALGAGAFLVWMKANPMGRKPVRILLVAPEPGPEAGISHYQARALALLLQDALETNPSYSVTLASAMPERPEDLKRPEPWVLVKLHPRRTQERLGLSLQWIWSPQLTRTPQNWEKAEIPQSPPTEAFRKAVLALPLEVQAAAVDALIPVAEGRFWELLQAGTFRLQNSDRQEAIRLARKVTEKEPNVATGWFTLGGLIYREILDSPISSTFERMEESEACFEKGLKLIPQHPRGTFQWAQLETNEGEHRHALDILLDALRRHPRNPLLLTGVVYTARQAGLLALGKAAAERRDRWAFGEVQPLAIDVLFLYLGDHARFEATLKDQPGHLRSTVQRFFSGYLALIRKDPVKAAEAFRNAESVPRGYPHYIQLARGFRQSAEGASKQAQETLRALELERIGLRVPDGEFTLRLAEGFALAGDLDHAMELAELAFSQGFGAGAWFEASPFLEPLRGTPRWRALMQHVRDRQSLLEMRFPVERLPQE